MSLRVAVLGATGLVGETLLAVLEQRDFPVGELLALASARSAGREISFAGRSYRIREATPDAFDGVDLVLSSAGGSVSKELLPHASAAGAISVDNTSAFRMDPDVPLVVPEVNGVRVTSAPRRIIANPNCSTIQLVMALKPIHDAFGVRRVHASTYQSVSGAGRSAVEALREGTARALSGEPDRARGDMAFNAKPWIDVFMDDASTKEEWKMVVETSKILEAEIPLHVTCVRVPTLLGHGVAASIETERAATPGDIRAVLSSFPGVRVVDDPASGVVPTVLDSTGGDDVLVGRVRENRAVENGIAMWIVADNIRKGAALNAVQIAEELIARGVFGVAAQPSAVRTAP